MTNTSRSNEYIITKIDSEEEEKVLMLLIPFNEISSQHETTKKASIKYTAFVIFPIIMNE